MVSQTRSYGSLFFVPFTSHSTSQGEVDITSGLTRKIDFGTSKAKKEDLDDPLKLVSVFVLPLKAPVPFRPT